MKILKEMKKLSESHMDDLMMLTGAMAVLLAIVVAITNGAVRW